MSTSEDLVVAAGRSVAHARACRLGFESDVLSFHQYRLLGKASRNCSLVPTRGIIGQLAAVKEQKEIAAIRKAVAITERVFRSVIDKIQPGVREADVAAEISFLQKKWGATGDAFEPIVAAGKRAAFPHARPTLNRIRRGNAVILDFGCTVDGYHSDMTRTVFVGEPGTRMRKAYAAVLEARDAAVSQVRSGVRSSVLDGVARRTLARHGFDKYFIHSLGHGLGLSIHEPPRISPMSTERLEAGNTVTIEPGVYLPGIGGIRIEDMVLVTSNGCEMLSSIPRILTIV
jgi:Xaa-Pro aminopeptidase